LISNLTLGGQSLIGAQWLLQAFKNGSFPATTYTRSKRGGKNGSKLISPTFASYQFVSDFEIIGNGFSDLALQRDKFLGILGTVHKGVKTLVATRSDGSSRQIDIKAIAVTGDLTVDDGTSSIIEATLEAEYPFLQSSLPKSQDVLIYNGGGMAIPMEIPLDISAGHTTSLTIANNGNYDAYPTFTFVGPLTNPTITITVNGVNQTLSINYTLATSGDSIVVDTFLGTVIIKPSGNIGRQYASGTFWAIPVGSYSVSLGNANTTDMGKCQIFWRDTFLNI